MTSACHETPSQYIINDTNENSKNSRVVRSAGTLCDKDFEKPNITFIHDLKKKVGPIK